MNAQALRALSGVRLTLGPVEDIESAAESLGWRCDVLDGAEVEARDGFLDLCDEAFGLPEWFGMSWEALEECLADLDHGGIGGVVMVWSSWGEFAEAEPADFAVALDVLAGAARAWAADGVAGGVVLQGDGPALDLELF